jgi:hypothetical protein
MAIQHKQLLSFVFHLIIDKVLYQVGNAWSVAVVCLCRNRDVVLPFVRKEHLQPPSNAGNS